MIIADIEGLLEGKNNFPAFSTYLILHQHNKASLVFAFFDFTIYVQYRTNISMKSDTFENLQKRDGFTRFLIQVFSSDSFSL
jgi:hypothetical protein